MLGLKRRGVRRCECETLLPKPGPLPQMSQTEATGSLLSEVEAGCRPGTPGPEVEGYPTERPVREPVGHRPLGLSAAGSLSPSVKGSFSLSVAGLRQLPRCGPLNFPAAGPSTSRP